MRARSAYRLIVTKGGPGPSLLDPERVDHLEVVDLESGEVVLFWDVPAASSGKLARRLREDLAELDAEEFVAAWEPTQRTT